MDVNLNNSVESHQIKSESNSVGKEPIVIIDKDNKLDKKCSDVSNIDNNVKIVNNVNCDLQHDLIKKNPNALDDINSFLDVELAINHNSLESLVSIQPIEINSSAIQNDNITKNCKHNLANVDLLNKNSNEKNISSNNDVYNKTLQEINVDLDVVSSNNFETFTVINKNNKTSDIFCGYNNIEDNTDKNDRDQLQSESINFQTFTVIKNSLNENIIDNDSQNDVSLNNETFEPESLNDYKTFTVNEINMTNSLGEECNLSNLMLSNSKPFINNNIIDLDVLPSTHTLTQCDAITILPQLNNGKYKVKVDDSVKNLNDDDRNKLNVSKINIASTKKENPKLDEFHNKINIKPEDNISKEIITYPNNFESFITSKEDSTIIKHCSDIITNKLCTFSNNITLNCISENSSSQTNNSSSYRYLEKLKSSDESDSTFSLHFEILENSIGINSPDSLNEDEVFDQEEKPIVSNKLEFVPLEATPIKDSRSPRLSKKYMEYSPVISANAYIPDTENISSTEDENSERKNSSSFFIDFNEGKPKNKPKRFQNLTNSLDSSMNTSNKEKIFSMFIDFNEDSESSESSFKGNKHRKPQTLADRFVRMHSEEAGIKSNDHENTVTPPPSRINTTVENSSVDISESCKKQSVFMFIENDSPTLVKRRSLPHSSRLKSQRNSWNVDSKVHKIHHRTHSVNLSEESNLNTRMTQSHIETGSKEFNKSPDLFNSVDGSVTIKVNGAKDSGIGLIDSFVRLSDMDKAPSQEMISNLNRCELKSDSLRQDVKNTELGRCLKRMFPYLKSIEVERILLSKPPHTLNSKEEIKTGLGQDLLRMFLEEIGADTIIDINGRRIKAHKCVLTSRCQYFAAMFSGGWVQSAGNVLYLKG